MAIKGLRPAVDVVRGGDVDRVVVEATPRGGWPDLATKAVFEVLVKHGVRVGALEYALLCVELVKAVRAADRRATRRRKGG